MNMKEKMTTRDFLNTVLADEEFRKIVVNGQTIESKATEMLEAINRRNTTKANGEKRPSKSYKENTELRARLLEYFQNREEVEPITAGALAETFGMSTPKVTGALRQMVDIDNTIERHDVGKNKPYAYSLKN